jgi:hypothetical protein
VKRVGRKRDKDAGDEEQLKAEEEGNDKIRLGTKGFTTHIPIGLKRSIR